jgi:6-phosphogluconolactonase
VTSDRPLIQPFENLAQLYQAAVDAFCVAVGETLQSSDTVSVSLSGGSTPQRLYELLSRRELPWERIHWFWGDERNVPPDHADSNTRMVRQALLDHVPVPQQNIHALTVDIDDPQSAAEAYEQELRSFFAGQSLPGWDLALLGLGNDAHTASLFPETSALDESEHWFVANWVPKFNTYRYTLTAAAINSARRSWFLVAGPGKRKALAAVLGEVRNPRLYPSQLIRPTRWFVDADAFPVR